MEKTPKFKVGDRVICVTTDKVSQKNFIGRRGVVSLVSTSVKGEPYAEVSFEDGPRDYSLFFHKLELEEVYNSPLYKALS